MTQYSNRSEEVVICTLGTRGDVLPFVALSSELRSRGVRVTFLTNRNWKSIVEATGADFFEIAEKDPPQDCRDEKDFFQFHIYPSFRRSFDFIAGKVGRGEKFGIIYRNNMLGAECACLRFSLVNIRVSLQPSSILSMYTATVPFVVPSESWGTQLMQLLVSAIVTRYRNIFEPFQKLSNGFRLAVGIKPIPWWRFPKPHEDLLLLLCPSWFAPPKPDWPGTIRMIGFLFWDEPQRDQDLVTFINQYGAPLVFSAGSGISNINQLATLAAAVCEYTSYPGILLGKSGSISTNASAPPVLCIENCDLSWLLPQSRLFIHHGGIGCTAQAIRAAIPQIAIPRRFDQPDNALRMAILGLGGAVFDPKISADELGSLVNALLGSVEVGEQLKIASTLVDGGEALRHAATLVQGAMKKCTAGSTAKLKRKPKGRFGEDLLMAGQSTATDGNWDPHRVLGPDS